MREFKRCFFVFLDHFFMFLGLAFVIEYCLGVKGYTFYLFLIAFILGFIAAVLAKDSNE